MLLVRLGVSDVSCWNRRKKKKINKKPITHSRHSEFIYVNLRVDVVRKERAIWRSRAKFSSSLQSGLGPSSLSPGKYAKREKKHRSFTCDPRNRSVFEFGTTVRISFGPKIIVISRHDYDCIAVVMLMMVSYSDVYLKTTATCIIREIRHRRSGSVE